MDLTEMRKLPTDLADYVVAARNLRNHMHNLGGDPEGKALVAAYNEAADRLASAIETATSKPPTPDWMHTAMAVLTHAGAVFATLSVVAVLAGRTLPGWLWCLATVACVVTARLILRRVGS